MKIKKSYEDACFTMYRMTDVRHSRKKREDAIRIKQLELKRDDLVGAVLEAEEAQRKLPPPRDPDDEMHGEGEAEALIVAKEALSDWDDSDDGRELRRLVEARPGDVELTVQRMSPHLWLWCVEHLGLDVRELDAGEAETRGEAIRAGKAAMIRELGSYA
ncbi:MAG: hypothetical protein FJ271_27420 [Planctomycetes bacterium]|nr:hypothetical protein [Planctomycetota bacterium]